jgi:hypothetical protein
MEHSPAPKQRTWRARLGVLLAIPLLIVGLGLAQAGPVRGDPLDDALAQQKALAAQLAAQQKALDALIAQQGALTAQLASTSAALAKTPQRSQASRHKWHSSPPRCSRRRLASTN